jgi:hypothetical protein
MRFHVLFLLISFYLVPATARENAGIRQQIESLIRNGKYDKAIAVLESLSPAIRSNTAFREYNEWLEDLYILKKQWYKIILLGEEYGPASGDSTTYAMARLFCLFPNESILFAAHPKPMPYVNSVTHTPLVEVTLQGKSYLFWVDTGAGMTVLSSTVAKRCQVPMSAERDASTTAATGKELSIGYGVIDSLRFGPVTVLHHPCLVIDSSQLVFDIPGIPRFHIDGIIGWNLLQEFSVTIRRNPETILFEPSKRKDNHKPDFFWMEVPMIACTDTLGQPLFFFLDTGAGTSSLREPILSKIDTTKAVITSKVIGSAGGTIKLFSLNFPDFAVLSQGHKITFHNLDVQPTTQHSTMAPDGTFGWKELIGYTMHFDFWSGIWEIQH